MLCSHYALLKQELSALYYRPLHFDPSTTNVLYNLSQFAIDRNGIWTRDLHKNTITGHGYFELQEGTPKNTTICILQQSVEVKSRLQCFCCSFMVLQPLELQDCIVSHLKILIEEQFLLLSKKHSSTLKVYYTRNTRFAGIPRC